MLVNQTKPTRQIRLHHQKQFLCVRSCSKFALINQAKFQITTFDMLFHWGGKSFKKVQFNWTDKFYTSMQKLPVFTVHAIIMQLKISHIWFFPIASYF